MEKALSSLNAIFGSFRLEDWRNIFLRKVHWTKLKGIGVTLIKEGIDEEHSRRQLSLPSPFSLSLSSVAYLRKIWKATQTDKLMCPISELILNFEDGYKSNILTIRHNLWYLSLIYRPIIRIMLLTSSDLFFLLTNSMIFPCTVHSLLQRYILTQTLRKDESSVLHQPSSMNDSNLIIPNNECGA